MFTDHAVELKSGIKHLRKQALVFRVGGSAGKESACSAGDLGLIPELGRSPGEGNGYPLQYSCLENSMDCIVHGVAKSWTRLSDFYFTAQFGRHFSFCSVQFSSVAQEFAMGSLRLHGLQHARPPCPSPTPGVYSNSQPLSR